MALNTINIAGADQTANSEGAKALLMATTRPTRLYNVTIFNTSGGAIYVQLFDASAEPASDDFALIQIKVLADSQASIDFQDGRPMKNGIFVGVSSTTLTYTSTFGTNTALIDVSFRNR